MPVAKSLFEIMICTVHLFQFINGFQLLVQGPLNLLKRVPVCCFGRVLGIIKLCLDGLQSPGNGIAG